MAADEQLFAPFAAKAAAQNPSFNKQSLLEGRECLSDGLTAEQIAPRNSILGSARTP